MHSLDNKCFIFSNIDKMIRKNKTIFKICKKILNLFKRLVYKLIFIHFSVDKKVMIFSSYTGKNFSCNPKAIYEAIIQDKRFKDYKFIWAFKDVNENTVNGTMNVKYGSLKYLYYLSIAKYWIFNAKMPGYYIKKKEQIYLQTWHGTPLKKLAKDIDIGDNSKFYRSQITKDEMFKTYTRDSSRYNYLISANKFSTKAFKSAFDIDENMIIETGYPRNDILVNASNEDIKNLKKKLSIPDDKKVILYAPTWRDNKYDMKGYLFDLKVDFNKWYDYLGDEYFVIYKPHYLIYNTLNLNINSRFMLDASNYNEINDLYLVSDMLITDYSSVFFDYGVLKKPVLFYMYDLEEYRDNLRGFYLDIYNDLPGPIIQNEEELLNKIININSLVFEFKDRNKNFYEEFCDLNDGNSSKKVIDILFNS